MPRKPNDVGAIWRKTNDRGEYLSISLEVEALLELAGGVVSKVFINAYPVDSDHPNAPAYQMKFYPSKTASQPARRDPRPPRQPIPDPNREPPPLEDDDEIPF